MIAKPMDTIKCWLVCGIDGQLRAFVKNLYVIVIPASETLVDGVAKGISIWLLHCHNLNNADSNCHCLPMLMNL